MTDDADRQLRPVTDEDRDYMRRLAGRGVPHMAIYYRLRDAGIDVKRWHLSGLPALPHAESKPQDYSIRLRPEVMEGLRDIAKQLGYEFYTPDGSVGVLPPLFEAIVHGRIALEVDDFGPEDIRLDTYATNGT